MKTSAHPDELILAISEIQARLKPTKRTARGEEDGRDYGYTPLDELMPMILPKLARKGIALFQETRIEFIEGRHFLVIVTRLALAGEWLEGEAAFPLGAVRATSNEVRAAGQLITYARRYHLCLLLGIVAERDDDAAACRPAGGQAAAARPAARPEQPAAAPAAAAPQGDEEMVNNEVRILKRVLDKALAAGKVKQEVYDVWLTKLANPGRNLKAITQTIMTSWGSLLQQEDPAPAAAPTPPAPAAAEPPAESYEPSHDGPPDEDLDIF